ncbi:MAG: hypothetical protein AB1488_04605 [Nitrospirota bacterium]
MQATLKKKAIEAIESLPGDKIKSIVDFIEYVKDKDAWRESEAIARDRKLMRRIKKADEDWKTQRKTTYTNWEKVKQGV